MPATQRKYMKRPGTGCGPPLYRKCHSHNTPGKGIITLESNPSRGTALPAPHGKYTEDDITNMLEFLVDNIFVSSGGKVFQEIFGIPIPFQNTTCLTRIYIDLTFYWCWIPGASTSGYHFGHFHKHAIQSCQGLWFYWNKESAISENKLRF